MKKITKKKIRKLITDEKNASKEYRSYGFTRLSHDEARHKKFLKRKLHEMKESK